MNAAATQGCVLPALDSLAQAPMEQAAVGPVAIGAPRQAARSSRNQVITSALILGLNVSVRVARDEGESRKCEC